VRKEGTVMRILFKLLFAFCLVAGTRPTFGQASLAAENIIDDVVVKVGSGSEVFTLFRDARNADQWYYVPNRPRLLEQSADGKLEPVFSLVRYQFADPQDAAKLVEEGILQFAATLSAPGDAVDAFKAAIKKRTGSDNVRVSAIPFKSADVAMYSYAGADGKSRLLSSSPYGSGLAPLFASQNMAFSLPLSKMGTDVLDTLVNGNTGLPVAVTFTFNALTPPAGFKITVDYKQLFSHYSSDEHLRASASYYGLFGASYEKSVQQIRESLINNGDIKIEVIAGEQLTLADVDKYMQPILARINSELLEVAKPPEAITPAVAGQPSGGGWFGGAGYSVAVKDVNKTKQTKEVWDMRVQQIVERKTIAQGFMGLGAYPDDVKKKVVVVVPESKFKSAFMMLPLPAIAEELDISNIDFQVALKTGDGKILGSQVVQWMPGGHWKDIGGNDRGVLVFPLAALAANDPSLKSAKFVTQIKITTPLQLLQFESTSSAFEGQRAMPGINGALFDVVEIDGSALSFKVLNPNGQLLSANAKLKVGPKIYNLVIKPKSVNGTWQPPAPTHVLLQSGASVPVSAQVTFQTIAGLKGWRYNGSNFVDVFSGLSVYLLDSDIVQ